MTVEYKAYLFSPSKQSYGPAVHQKQYFIEIVLQFVDFVTIYSKILEFCSLPLLYLPRFYEVTATYLYEVTSGVVLSVHTLFSDERSYIFK